jgi:hypothetical protein
MKNISSSDFISEILKDSSLSFRILDHPGSCCVNLIFMVDYENCPGLAIGHENYLVSL